MLRVAVSLVLSFNFSWASVVEDDSEEGTGIRSEFSHLLLEVTVIVSWEILDGFGHGGKFTHENEHVLGQILGNGFDFTGILAIGALLHDVVEGLLEMAGAQVLQDLGSFGEKVEVLGDVSTGNDGHWVNDDRVEGDHVVDGRFVEALRGILFEVSLIESFVVTTVESLDSIDVPEGILKLLLIGHGGGREKSLNLWDFSTGIGDSEHGSESEGGVGFHLVLF